MGEGDRREKYKGRGKIRLKKGENVVKGRDERCDTSGGRRVEGKV